MPRHSVGQSEHTLRDDVVLHFRRATLDRVGLAPQPRPRLTKIRFLELIPFPTEHLRTQDLHEEFETVLVLLCAVQLEHGRRKRGRLR